MHPAHYPPPEPLMPVWLGVTVGVIGTIALLYLWSRLYRSGWSRDDPDFSVVTTVCFAYSSLATIGPLWLGVLMATA